MTEQVTNEFGIKFIPDEEVPEASRQNNRNPGLWKAILTILKSHPNQWAQVQEFEKSTTAGAKASQINNDKNKTFPAAEWEARSTKTENSSVLFMRYVGSDTGPVSDAEAEAAAENA